MDAEFLREIYPYPLVAEAEFAEVAAAHLPGRMERGQALLAVGKQANSYYVIREGWAREWVMGVDGTEITTRFFGPGTLMLEPASLFRRIPSASNLEALTDGSVLEVTYPDFEALFHRLPGIREWGRAWMSNELFLLRERSIDMLTRSATDRYRSLLDEQPELLASAPLKYVASYLGITDSSLSRIRKEVSRSGMKLS